MFTPGQQQKSFPRYTGWTKLKFVALNPTAEERALLFGMVSDKETKPFGDNSVMRLELWFANNDLSIVSNFSVFMENKTVTRQKQSVDKKTGLVVGEAGEAVFLDNFGKFCKTGEGYTAFKGEFELINALRTICDAKKEQPFWVRPEPNSENPPIFENLVNEIKYGHKDKDGKQIEGVLGRFGAKIIRKGNTTRLDGGNEVYGRLFVESYTNDKGKTTYMQRMFAGMNPAWSNDLTYAEKYFQDQMAKDKKNTEGKYVLGGPVLEEFVQPTLVGIGSSNNSSSSAAAVADDGDLPF